MPQLAAGRRNQLDTIIQKMDSAGASPDEVQTVVADFVSKYGEADSGPDSMASLREMAQMNEPLSDAELNTTALQRSTAPAMIGAAVVPAMAGSRLMQAAGSPLGIGAIRAGIAYGRGEGPMGIASEGLRGVSEGTALRVTGGLLGKLPERLASWINRGRASSAVPIPATVPRPASVTPFPANPQEAAAAMSAPSVTRPAPPPVVDMAGNPSALTPEAVAARRAVSVPAAESSTLEEQLRQTVKMSKGARKALPEAQNLEARIVEWKTRQGQSEPQIVDSLKKIFGINEPGAAKEMTDLVLRAHGLKR